MLKFFFRLLPTALCENRSDFFALILLRKRRNKLYSVWRQSVERREMPFYRRFLSISAWIELFENDLEMFQSTESNKQTKQKILRSCAHWIIWSLRKFSFIMGLDKNQQQIVSRLWSLIVLVWASLFEYVRRMCAVFSPLLLSREHSLNGVCLTRFVIESQIHTDAIAIAVAGLRVHFLLFVSRPIRFSIEQLIIN